MNTSVKLALGLVLLCGSIEARYRPTVEWAFIDAARDGKHEIIDRLIASFTSRRTYDKALHAAARKGDLEMCCKIAPYASSKGRRIARESFESHTARVATF